MDDTGYMSFYDIFDHKICTSLYDPLVYDPLNMPRDKTH